MVSTAHADEWCQELRSDEEPPVVLPYLCSVAHRFSEVQFLIRSLFDTVNPFFKYKRQGKKLSF